MKKRTALNPYLPLWEYIPDAEPRVFGDRLYVYGSHDFAGGEKGFCPGDYMVWSAPLEDLGNWRCDGVAFSRKDCPGITDEVAMEAPDVVQGPDGRYYLYFTPSRQWVCYVAVSTQPIGPFKLLGPVQTPDGQPYGAMKMFDPGVLVDGNEVYLFAGFSSPGPLPDYFRNRPNPFMPANQGFHLAADMRTILEGPVPIIPGWMSTAGTGFEGHGFYEASSPRKINGCYVMVYSSEQSHELAYALADKPLGPYRYEGVLVSNADIGLQGRTQPVMPYGNTHGGLVQLHGDWYVFYHRQTHAIECCRQGCAEKLPLREDGWFGQAEITSCGLNEGPLPAQGSYNACHCCYLRAPQNKDTRLTIRECRRDTEVHIFEDRISEEMLLHYIANIRSGTTVGYKYFRFCTPASVSVLLCGQGICSVQLRLDSPQSSVVLEVKADLSGQWQEVPLGMLTVEGIHAVYLSFETRNAIKFKEFSFSCQEESDEGISTIASRK